MIFKNSAILLALGASAVNGLYSNQTTVVATTSEAVDAVALTTTITPNYSVKPVESVATYADDTTTFYVTNTIYSTHWITNSPIITSSSSVTTEEKKSVASTTKALASSSLSSLKSQVTSFANTKPYYGNVTALQIDNNTSTTTSTLLTTITQNNKTLGCIPKTKYVTVTASAEIQYVTITKEAKTSFVTVTAQPPSSAFWSNSTKTN